VVVPTKLAGFTPATFTKGPQRAFRQTIASDAGTTVDKVIITNIRAARRRLGEEHRELAAAAVDFDTSISVANAAAATAMKTVVAAITPATIKAKFVAELKTAKASGEFPAMASVNVVALASTIAVTKQAPQQVTVTAKVPVAKDDFETTVVVAVGSVLGLALMGLAAKKRCKKGSPAPGLACQPGVGPQAELEDESREASLSQSHPHNKL
jgi:hypothetical protein